MPDLPFASIAAAGAIITFAYTVFGITGFGATIVGVPLLAQFLPIRFVVPMMLVFDLSAGLLLGLRNRGDVDRGELLRLAPFDRTAQPLQHIAAHGHLGERQRLAFSLERRRHQDSRMVQLHIAHPHAP